MPSYFYPSTFFFVAFVVDFQYFLLSFLFANVIYIY